MIIEIMNVETVTFLSLHLLKIVLRKERVEIILELCVISQKCY